MCPRTRQDLLKSIVCNFKRLAQAGVVVAIAASSPAFCSATPPVHSQTGAYYAQSDFTLPFQIKPGGRCPQNLDLLMSRDGGKSWQVVQTAAPAERGFRIAHAAEGEYWMKVQVRDSAGAALANSTMHVFVDTTRPQATLLCDWQSDSKLLLSGKIMEAHLDAATIQLTMRTDLANEPVLVPLELTTAANSSVDFHAALDLPNCKSFELRLTAADRAGNRSTISERYFHPVLADENDALLPLSDDVQLETKADQPTGLQIAAKDWTAVELGTPKAASQTQLVAMRANQQIVRKADNANSQLEELIPPPRANELTLEAPASPDALQTEPRVLSSSRKFKINYDLGASIPSNQLHVELWVTNDGGSTWEFWGLDQDAQAPAWIEVDSDGDYGFCVVCVHAETDFRFRPQAGDKPDLTVAVKEPPTQRRLEPAARD